MGIPFSALVSVIFGLMILSFPLGAYVVFNSNIEDGVRYDFPINGFNFFPAGIGIEIPIEIEIGDAFIGLWGLYIVLFSIAMFGPKVNFLKALSPIMSEGKYESKSNYLVSIIKWFSILIVISGIINLIQESIGITTLPPVQPDSLIQFFEITVAPISEEIGFRVMLIGIPLFLMYSNRGSIILFFKTLWHPTQTLHIYQIKKTLILITLVGIFFGAAHIISGEPWSLGKFAQATASGIIIGWVYFKHGLISAILVHWATNYFIFSYVNFLAEINDITVKNAFSHSLTNSLEILFVMSGILSLALIIVNYLNVKNKKPLEI
ncbi:MAG TPA: CPBP family intramembrane glutamic endopeptidase [Nitrosopumilaceae archaeon]|nr:CPBP family intramembrane glutamic endopeptidase [Nitrosopumilaceae archaeon]